MPTGSVAINAQLTAEELQAVIADNASYRSQNSLTMADNLIDAIEALRGIPVSEVDHSGERVRIEINALLDQQKNAIKWRNIRRATLGPPTFLIPATKSIRYQ